MNAIKLNAFNLATNLVAIKLLLRKLSGLSWYFESSGSDEIARHLIDGKAYLSPYSKSNWLLIRSIN